MDDRANLISPRAFQQIAGGNIFDEFNSLDEINELGNSGRVTEKPRPAAMLAEIDEDADLASEDSQDIGILLEEGDDHNRFTTRETLIRDESEHFSIDEEDKDNWQGLQ